MESSNKRLYAALAAEFLGMLLFALYGGEARDSAAAYGNGLTLAVLVYATANISGGHLNPAVTLASIISGHIQWRKGILYMIAQFLGGIVGESGLVVMQQPTSPAVRGQTALAAMVCMRQAPPVPIT